MTNASDNGAGISIRNLAFSYAGTPVFTAVNLNIPKGEIWALVGRSGVGKTTLLQVIAGLFQPTCGDVVISGRGKSNLGKIRGIVFQEDCLLGWLTAEENVLFPYHRKCSAEQRSNARRLVDEVGLAGRYSALPKELSTGMRKRLEFARALAADEDYFLADEPFGPLDALTRRELWQLWQQLRAGKRRTGILSTHDPEEAVRLCDAVVALKSQGAPFLGEVIRIPSDLHQASISEQDVRVATLKDKVIQAL